ncbi:hypothetical protein [Glutamicibacter nicotianae]|uniref:hypothetical protein n=1 Tax=Glutamicibacter nicotianae TaxID=37929 RepID=UPI00195E4A8F|nr:hypothetical protein [Glutamicibacter nicotianae]MBM7767377.1 preprotein translocase subunit SecB [Glutamicibacter nicotianae]
MPENVDIHLFVEDVSLLDIVILELSAVRSNKEQGNDELAKGFIDGEYNVETDFSMSMARDTESNKKFRIQVTTDIISDPGKIYVETAAEYALNDLNIDDIDESLMLDFANRVALMTLLPFIRQSVADVSQRVFIQPLTMPIFKAGELAFN